MNKFVIPEENEYSEEDKDIGAECENDDEIEEEEVLFAIERGQAGSVGIGNNIIVRTDGTSFWDGK